MKRIQELKIGFIGCGNMGGALLDGILASGTVSPQNVVISDLDENKLGKYKNMGSKVTFDSSEVAEAADIIFFAVKPNIIETVLKSVTPQVDKIYISMAAGVDINKIEKVLGTDKKIIRIMPNTPAKVNCGMTVLSHNINVIEEELSLAEQVLSGTGEIVRLDEKYINAATALHGSSPAYVYMMIDAMADAGVRYGIPKNVALKLSAKAVEGSAKMVLESDEHPEKLKDNVCSPGGTTIAAVCSLEENRFRHTLQEAIDKCVKKADELA